MFLQNGDRGISFEDKFGLCDGMTKLAGIALGKRQRKGQDAGPWSRERRCRMGIAVQGATGFRGRRIGVRQLRESADCMRKPNKEMNAAQTRLPVPPGSIRWRPRVSAAVLRFLRDKSQALPCGCPHRSKAACWKNSAGCLPGEARQEFLSADRAWLLQAQANSG